jgi:hypothetical protein
VLAFRFPARLYVHPDFTAEQKAQIRHQAARWNASVTPCLPLAFIDDGDEAAFDDFPRDSCADESAVFVAPASALGEYGRTDSYGCRKHIVIDLPADHFENTVLHELGHTAIDEHSEDPDSVMHVPVLRTSAITNDDAEHFFTRAAELAAR